MRIVVTGGTGAVGRRLVPQLRDDGHDVVVLGRTASADTAATDYSVDDLTEHLTGADAVVHLAWRREPAPDLAAFATNLNAMQNLLEAALAAGVARIVYASSISVYAAGGPWDESAPAAPGTAYGLSKLAGEGLLTLDRYASIRSIALRIGHVFTDDEDNNYAVNSFLRSAEAGDPITVSGDAARRRDMVYSQDVVQAIILALQHHSTTGPVNVGSGAPVTMGDLAEAASAAFGGRSTVTRNDAPADGAGSTHLALDRAKQLLGYRPAFDLPAAMEDIAARRSARS